MGKGDVLYVFQSHAAFRRRMAEEKETDRPWDFHNRCYVG
jgi:hypothetical protein